MNDLMHKRNYTLDVARILAIFAVIMIHCSASFVTDYGTHTNEFILGNLLDSISRLGVPMFLMISGALFLDEQKEITLKTILHKNVKSIAFITIAWATIYSVIYNIVMPLLKGTAIDFKEAIFDLLNGHYHMWYLYMIMGLYIITPFLKKFVCKEKKEMVLFFIFISFMTQFLLPTIDKICMLYLGIDFIGDWIDKFHLDFFGGYITYYLSGWYIVHIGIKQKTIRRIIYSVGFISVVFVIFYSQFTGNYNDAYQNIGAPVFLYSVSVFLALNNLQFNFKAKTAKIITTLSKLTFGVYIIHILVLTVFKILFPYNKPLFVYIFVCFFVVTCVSFLCVYLISKTPLIKKLIKL